MVDSFLNVVIIDMLVSSGMVDDACRVFLESKEKNIICLALCLMVLFLTRATKVQ